MKDISQLPELVPAFRLPAIGGGRRKGRKKGGLYKVHGCNLTSCTKVRSTRVRIRQFDNDLAPIAHGKLKHFVVLAFWKFNNPNARLRSNSRSGKFQKILHVKLDIAACELLALSP